MASARRSSGDRAVELTERGQGSDWVAPCYLAACIVAGGSSSQGFLANCVLQIAGLVLIATFLFRRASAPIGPSARTLLMIVGTVAAFLTVSLIPLPVAIWHGLGNRGPVAAAYALAGLPVSAMPVSLAPDGTIATLLSLLPPVAMFLTVIAASPRGRGNAVLMLVALAVVSIVFGVLQQVSGYRSTLYLYDITSRGGATGFFANRNHLATLCLMAMPMVVALQSPEGATPDRAARVGRNVLVGATLLFLVLGALVVQSVAGWLLLIPTLLGCLLVRRRTRGTAPSPLLAQAAALTLLAAVAAALFAPINPVDVDGTSGEMRSQDRRQSMTLTARAAVDYLPAGSGFGSFQRVYPQQEDPRRTTNTFVNHAHNDYLELALEGGVIGLLLLAAFLLWWGRQVIAVWRRGGVGTPTARAATVGVAVLLAHSFVDYPIRTAAIGAVAALACALMTATREVEAAERARGASRPGARTIALGRPARALEPVPFAWRRKAIMG